MGAVLAIAYLVIRSGPVEPILEQSHETAGQGVPSTPVEAQIEDWELQSLESRVPHREFIQVRDRDGNAVPGARVRIVDLSDWSTVVEAAAGELRLAPDSRLPGSLICVTAPGFLPFARRVPTDTASGELADLSFVLSELAVIPFVQSLGDRRSLHVQWPRDQRGAAPRQVYIHADALGWSDVWDRVDLNPRQRLVIRAWASDRGPIPRDVMAELFSRDGKSDYVDLHLSRSVLGGGDPRVYRMPSGAGAESLVPLDIRFVSGREGGWCNDKNRPRVILLEAEYSRLSDGSRDRRSVFAIWQSELRCYRAMLSEGAVTLRRDSTRWPMPVGEALPLPLVGEHVVTVAKDAASLTPRVIELPLQQDARVVEVPKVFGYCAAPGLRWLLQDSESGIEAMRRSRYGSFHSVLPPGEFHLGWDVGPEPTSEIAPRRKEKVFLPVFDLAVK